MIFKTSKHEIFEQKLLELQINLNYLNQQAELDKINNTINLITLDKIKNLKNSIDKIEQKLIDTQNSKGELFCNVKMLFVVSYELLKMRLEEFINSISIK